MSDESALCPCESDHDAAHVPGCPWAAREFQSGLPFARRAALAGEHPGERDGYICYPRLNHNAHGDAYCWVYRRVR